MVVKLGRKQHPDDALGRLVHCHDRIRSFLEVTARIGRAEALDEDVKSAAREVHRYFSDALPRHVEDEELSLLPRLRGRDPDLDLALERMEEQHRAHEPLVSSLLSICEAMANATEIASELIEVGDRLGRDLAAHLDEEEAIIFPAIERLLSKSEQQEILAEMKARRSG